MGRFTLTGLVAAIVWLGLTLAGAQTGFSSSGRVGATEQEAQEGYFALDGQTMIVVKPGSELHGYLRGQIGRRVRLTLTPEPESE
jgi:hypothetical protein